MTRKKSVVLSGFMATGKSTVGELVARALGLPFIDTDALIAAEAGVPVGDAFAKEGEARFRERETAIILPLLSDGVARVIAFGGGAVTVPRVRHAALEVATVITLTADPAAIVARAAVQSATTARPNLGSSAPAERTADLLTLRREAYGECHASIATDNLAPEAVAARIVAIATRDAIAVPLGTRSYVVELGDSEPAMLAAALEELRPSSIVTVTDANVIARRGAWLDAALAGSGVGETRVVLPPGEEHKNIDTVTRIWDAALNAGIDRQALVLAFGGGVVGDMAGFAASTLLRGVRCVQIGTTLLAMVDSSVGGKTGFDHPTGKNLLGAFFQPSRVILDLEHLSTLSTRERAAGLAEVVKIALVRDRPLLDLLEAESDKIAAGDRAVLREVVRRSVIAKMRVVREDEHELGVRALLNLGHTVGHALEAHGGYSRWLHGEAIAMGTAIELDAAARLGVGALDAKSRAADLLRRFQLPIAASKHDLEAAWPFVMRDKKRTRTAVRLPVVTKLGEGKVERVEIEALRDAVLSGSDPAKDQVS